MFVNKKKREQSYTVGTNFFVRLYLYHIKYSIITEKYNINPPPPNATA